MAYRYSAFPASSDRGLAFAVKRLRQPRIHFDHFVLFLNKRIVQHVENDQFLINDDFNQTNKRRVTR